MMYVARSLDTVRYEPNRLIQFVDETSVMCGVFCTPKEHPMLLLHTLLPASLSTSKFKVRVKKIGEEERITSESRVRLFVLIKTSDRQDRASI